MTVRNLDALFRPRSLALFGASNRAGSLGAVLARNVAAGGFAGDIVCVNPHETEIAGLPCYPDAASLPATPDLAVIATPPAAVPGIVAELGARGTRGVVVITAGFDERDAATGRTLREALLDAARPTLMRVVGPNGLGIIVPGIGLNASFAHIAPSRGDVAFVAQSGAVIASVLDWTASRRIGFSHLVSLGDKADVDFGDMLDYLAADPATRSILLYIEAISDARKFLSAARAASRTKPVVVIKPGRHAGTARAVASHTGALAGSDAVYDAAFRRAGLLRVRDLAELLEAVETLALVHGKGGDRLAILTNGGGMGILATEALLDLGGTLAELSPETIGKLDRVLPRTWSRGNPVDIIGDAPGSRYRDALEILIAAKDNDAILVLNCPTAVASATEAAEAVVAAASGKRKQVLTGWISDEAGRRARELFAEHGLPSYQTPAAAVGGFMHLVNWRHSQAQLMETPPAPPRRLTPDRDAARAIVEAARAEKRDWLMEHEAKSVLAAYGVPTTDDVLAATATEAADAAARLGGPVALKIVSPDITHKSDVGGVALDLATPEDAAGEADAMLARVHEAMPDARLLGVNVQRMVARPGAYELIVGMTVDAQFGPVMLFGHGGTAVEVIDDTALELPPLNLRLARRMMARTRVYRLLSGYRGHPPAALDEIARTLVAVADLITDLDAVAELDINPLLADRDGVIALDARMRIAAPARLGVARLAIRPYPRELERRVATPGGLAVVLRPIRPEDEPALKSAYAHMSGEAIRMRFFAAMAEVPHALLARLSQIDYDREMALVAFAETDAEQREILAVARFAAEPDGRRAEYAVEVRTDQSRKGLGETVMRHLIEVAKARGIAELYGVVLAENQAMIRLATKLGMRVARQPDDPNVVMTTLTLFAEASV